MPLTVYDSQLQKALTAPKLAVATNEEITKAIQYAMQIVGIRAHNLPVQTDFDFMKDWVRRNFPVITTDEIRMAFDMAASGRLTMPEGETANAYENFSCEYLGRILKAYKAWAAKEWAYIPEPEKPSLPPPEANWQPIWEDILQAARTGNLENKIIGEPVYQWLTETGQLKLSVEDRKVLFLNAKNRYQAELVTLLQLNQITGSQRQEYEAMKNGEIENDLHAKIAIRAKIMAVKSHALETIKTEKCQ